MAFLCYDSRVTDERRRLDAALETALVRALKSAYDDLNATYFKSKMRPATISLTDASGYLGRYDERSHSIEISRALVVEPEILLLDEPLSNLDANLREEMRFEIRRLHEAFGITTLYVTHDQAEAMVISDRVAVLHRGRVEQVGTAEDLFRRPRTRFVAEFIGRTNLVDAVAAEPGLAVRAALRLRLASRDTPAGAPVVISIRPHEIELVTAGRSAPAGANVLPGTVQRASYLGDAVDYQVAVNGADVVLRVTAPPPARVAPGESVTLAIAPEACVPLTDAAPPGKAG